MKKQQNQTYRTAHTCVTVKSQLHNYRDPSNFYRGFINVLMRAIRALSLLSQAKYSTHSIVTRAHSSQLT